MNSRLQKQATALAALSIEDRSRLERLAALVDMAPEDLWPEVWQYGFDDVEDSIQAELDGIEDIKAGRTIPHEQVMEQALQILEAHVENRRKAG
ncbi:MULTISPECIES: hypothetical protein [unclassified Duganella]|uniref:hypothetical protein n=1 Tax=unclassified Duganella TaxID=2636909 RepID=UPI000885FD4F|nr:MULTISPECIES: hypothetical protein [unclassified Duganella]SDG69934.1 hypothetical protein SAMN05216320_106212 [Duganella sp. OV458]SDJ95368.1 hypothetical protein SAMN05428973_107213 [Duganella sp. OV510]